MGEYSRKWVLTVCCVLCCVCLAACNSGQEKSAKVIVTDSEFNIRQTHENSYVLDVRGKVKNVGDVDLKKVVVTGYCKSCILEFTSQHWFTSDCDKTENQMDIISYLAVGAEEDFRFEEVAFYFTHEKNPPESRPENIEIVIESFERVD